MENLIADLRARKLIQDITPGIEDQLLREMTTGYIGFDPTADSLHVGSLLPITLLMRFQRAGHKPIALVGGATGAIGDPSGKSAERNLQDAATINQNVAGIRRQLEQFLDFSGNTPNSALLVNNADWINSFSFIDFIREAGKYITVSYMMSKDSVQKRLETGLSFTEFSYQLIQGYDFYYLNKTYGAKLQMGGADQWGNITTGTELIRRKAFHETGAETEVPEAFAFTCPLVTKSDGTKFGKSEGGNVWLDAEKTSPYQFYQFWLGLTDAEAKKMSYTFSFRTVADIEELIATHREAPHARALQIALATELTTLVHGEAALKSALRASEILFGKSTVAELNTLTESELLNALGGVPRVEASVVELETLDLLSFLADKGVFASKGEARKMITAGGFSINKEKVSGIDFKPSAAALLSGKYLLLQKGKKDYTLAVFNP
ncbi:MAG: tyrosine--tRNA ligase [Sphingobacteriales bacterium]|nr:MAG: tyrosine--tRNA ligase [Sphingobacteriales bacterium]